MIEVELFHPSEDNVLIVRQFDKAGKSVWKINGKKAGVREVEKKVAEFRIQVDNLCQFLPQDKVHDFSRLDSKGLLNSTVDAVGDVSLKDQHTQLKEMQKSMSEGEELFERKQKMLVDETEKCRKLEEEVKAFEEKKKIEASVKLAEQRLAWSKLHEVGCVYMDAKNSWDDAKKVLSKKEQKLMPLKKEINENETKKGNTERRLTAINTNLKESTQRAKTHSSNVENLEERIDQVEDEVYRMEQAEEKKKEEIEQMKQQITEMESELSSTQDETDLAPLINQAMKRTGEALDAKDAKFKEYENLKYERQHMARTKGSRLEEMTRLNDIDKMKMRKLQELNQDAYDAVLWLRNNRNMFQHQVHEPFIVSANINDPKYSIYLENAINPRDLVAFFFEDEAEMNQFLNIVRDEKNLRRVSAVLMPQQRLEEFKPNVSEAALRNYNFIAYLKDLVSAPDQVLAFICQQYGIHRIPLFKESADKHLEKFINQLRFTKIFIGNRLHSVSGSLYSAAKTTMSKEIFSKKLLEISKDEEREGQLKSEIASIDAKLLAIETSFKQIEKDLQELNITVEEARKEQKELEHRRNYKARQTALIESRRRILREKLSELGSSRGKDELINKKKSFVVQQIKSVQLLQTAIKESNNLRTQIELVRFTVQPLDGIIQRKRESLREMEDQMKDARKEVERLEMEHRAARDIMIDAMKDAHRITGGHGARKEQPPDAKVKEWEAEKIPSKFEDLNIFINDLKARADCLGDVDPRIIREYNRMKETIEELQQDIQARESTMNDKMMNMRTLRDAWVENLNNLVNRINENFSAHFQTMGFAGEVSLKTGSHENDFDNYGIRIRVKYRDSEPLQDLTASHQSGGERSVATALYMLALQELTTVPFR